MFVLSNASFSLVTHYTVTDHIGNNVQHFGRLFVRQLLLPDKFEK